MIAWLTVGNKKLGGRIEAWKRTVAIIGEDVYAPAILGGDEAAVARVATMEGVRMLRNDNHAYLPTWWLASHYPGTADLSRMLESRAKPMLAAMLAQRRDA